MLLQSTSSDDDESGAADLSGLSATSGGWQPQLQPEPEPEPEPELSEVDLSGDLDTSGGFMPPVSHVVPRSKPRGRVRRPSLYGDLFGYVEKDIQPVSPPADAYALQLAAAGRVDLDSDDSQSHHIDGSQSATEDTSDEDTLESVAASMASPGKSAGKSPRASARRPSLVRPLSRFRLETVLTVFGRRFA